MKITESGYNLYGAEAIERLEQILLLKYLISIISEEKPLYIQKSSGAFMAFKN